MEEASIMRAPGRPPIKKPKETVAKEEKSEAPVKVEEDITIIMKQLADLRKETQECKESYQQQYQEMQQNQTRGALAHAKVSTTEISAKHGWTPF